MVKVQDDVQGHCSVLDHKILSGKKMLLPEWSSVDNKRIVIVYMPVGFKYVAELPRIFCFQVYGKIQDTAVQGKAFLQYSVMGSAVS